VTAFALLLPDMAIAALGAVASKAKLDTLSVQALARIATLAPLEPTAAQSKLKALVNGPSPYRNALIACVLANLSPPQNLEALLSAEFPKKALEQCTITSEYMLANAVDLASKTTTDLPAHLLDPEMIHLTAYYRFQSGVVKKTEWNTVTTTTYFEMLPLRVSRQESQFGAGDRWPLDRHYEIHPDPIVLACARYTDPRADACIRTAATAKDPKLRSSALWALTLRDDRAAVEPFLRDKSKDVGNEAIRALRLLGHRASIVALAPYVQKNTEAAIAVIEIGMGLGRGTGDIGER